mgnify:FL=1
MTEQRNGLVLKCIGGFYYVEAADAVYECRARGIFRKREITPLAGDHVRFTPQEVGTGSLDAVESRRNFLVRPPVANVDCLLVVAAVTDPAPHLLVLDKMIAIAEYKGIEPVVVVNKCDLGSAQALEEIYRKAGLQVIALSAGKGQGIDELRTHIAGKVSVLTGNSGVGKSSLLNRIDPALQLETGEISRKLGRGRHTTRVACLYPLAGGGYIVDTPGFSSLDMEKAERIPKEELAGCFREFGALAGRCKYASCTHVKEDGCAVLAAVERGAIAPSRQESYAAMYNEAKEWKEWEYK